MFRYFEGAADLTEVKKRFRALALQHHPDKGGDTLTFQSINAEYKRIVTDAHIVYPITNIQQSVYSSIEDVFNEARRRQQEAAWRNQQNWQKPHWWNQQAAWESERRAREEFKEAEDLARRQREAREKRKKNPEQVWKEKKDQDFFNYSTIESIFDQTVEEGRTVRWMTMEIFKSEGLGLDHFNYLAYLVAKDKRNIAGFEFTSTWAANTYRNYIAVQNIGL